jgi:hypothetical protein
MDLPPSKIPKFENSGSSDLLSRVSSFLPKLQQANDELNGQDVENQETIDPDFIDSSDDDEESDSEEATSSVDEKVSAKKSTSLTLKLKADDDKLESSHESDDSEANEEEEEEDSEANEDSGDRKESAIDKLLKQSSKKRSRGPLIEELS